MQQLGIALIPAYEPTENLAELARELRGAGFLLVVVDDGSGEKYRSVFMQTAENGVVLTHEVNKGKGCALKTGLAYIGENFPQDAVIVTLDADGQHSIADTVRVCAAAEKNRGTLVLGCRSFPEGTPAKSRFGNTLTRFIYRLATGVRVSDTQTGLRAFGCELVPFLLGVDGARYEYEMNVILECPRRKLPMKEVAIETIYFDNNAGSHFNAVRDSFLIYREIIKFTASSFLGFLVDYALYSLFILLTGGLGQSVGVLLSNVLARVISSTVNYAVNKHLVFQHHGSAVKSAAQYFALAAVILAGNTLMLSLLTHGIGINKFTAKIITELTFFIISLLVQKFIIFRNKVSPENH